LPKAVLTDQMKSVLLKMEDKVPKWHPVFAEQVAFAGHRTTSLSSLHAPKEGKSRAQRFGAQAGLLAGHPLP
jgi:hypothetical protein